MWILNANKQFEPTRHRFELSARSWFRWYAFWLYLHYILGLLIVIFSALIATGDRVEGFLPDWLGLNLLAVISGILAASVTFLRPNEKAATFRARWLLLNKELLNPKNKPDEITPLYEAYLKAESMANGMVLDNGIGTPDATED